MSGPRRQPTIFEAAQTYYQNLNPAAARLLAKRIVDAARHVRERPQIGRAGLRESTREWVVLRTPYVLVYRQSANALQILHVWHTAQDCSQRAD